LAIGADINIQLESEKSLALSILKKGIKVKLLKLYFLSMIYRSI
jgi:hypothetical protein